MIDQEIAGERRQWAYTYLTPLYSYEELARMGDDELKGVIDSLAYECPDCGGIHDGTTTGTEQCPSCDQELR